MGSRAGSLQESLAHNETGVGSRREVGVVAKGHVRETKRGYDEARKREWARNIERKPFAAFVGRPRVTGTRSGELESQSYSSFEATVLRRPLWQCG